VIPDIDSEQKKVLPIVEYPEIPSQIIEAYNKKRLVIFIGAGVSRLVGCKGWDELARDLIEKCYNTQNEINESLINFNIKSKLSNISDHRKTITICKKLLEKVGKVDAFFEVLEKALDVNDESGKSNLIYENLFSLQAKYVTTNADNKFSRLFEEINVTRDPRLINNREMRERELLHIHGSFMEPKTLVFDLPSYFEKYSNLEFKNTLKKIFSGNTVLFLGYGMTELEILEFLLEKSIGKSIEPLYLLSGYYSSELDYFRLEQTYYDSMNIKVIPYRLDSIGYEQLGIVISEWVQQMRYNSTFLSDSIELISREVI